MTNPPTSYTTSWDTTRISVDAASDSVFSPNFRRVWPLRLSGSAAAVMAKETSRTKSAER